MKTLAQHYDPASHHAEDNDSIPDPLLLATVDMDEDQGEPAVVVPAAAAMP